MRPHKNILEWLVFGGSSAVIVAVIAVLIVAGVKSHDQPPVLEMATGTPFRSGDVFQVPVHVRNEGDKTAEQVSIEVVLLAGDRVVERGELSLAYVPRKSRREAWVTFRTDPSCCAIATRAIGYNEP